MASGAPDIIAPLDLLKRIRESLTNPQLVGEAGAAKRYQMSL
ncbi:MAG: hypothetical protein ACYC0L_00315 [Thermoleophilia bacterium]